MFDPLLLPELREMLIENDTSAMQEFCEVFHPGIVAENLEALPAADSWRVLSQAAPRRRGEIFEFFSRPRQMELVTTDANVTSDVKILHTPGHTPGSVSILVESGGESRGALGMRARRLVRSEALVGAETDFHRCELYHAVT